jgi:hypothetical protein
LCLLEGFGITRGYLAPSISNFFRVLRAVVAAIANTTLVAKLPESKAFTVFLETLAFVALTKNTFIFVFLFELHLHHLLLKSLLLFNGFSAETPGVFFLLLLCYF